MRGMGEGDCCGTGLVSVRFWVQYTVLTGEILMQPGKRLGRRKHDNAFSYMTFFMGFYPPRALLQGHCYEKSKRDYDSGKYEAALAGFTDETERWYLRLTYNYRE